MIIKLILLVFGIVTGLVGLFFTWLVEGAFAAEVIMVSYLVFIAMLFICIKSFRKNWKLFRSPDYEQYKIERARIKQERYNKKVEKRCMKAMRTKENSCSNANGIGMGKVLLIVCGSIVYLFFGSIVLLTSQYMKRK